MVRGSIPDKITAAKAMIAIVCIFLDPDRSFDNTVRGMHRSINKIRIAYRLRLSNSLIVNLTYNDRVCMKSG